MTRTRRTTRAARSSARLDASGRENVTERHMRGPAGQDDRSGLVSFASASVLSSVFATLTFRSAVRVRDADVPFCRSCSRRRVSFCRPCLRRRCPIPAPLLLSPSCFSFSSSVSRAKSVPLLIIILTTDHKQRINSDAIRYLMEKGTLFASGWTLASRGAGSGWTLASRGAGGRDGRPRQEGRSRREERAGRDPPRPELRSSSLVPRPAPSRVPLPATPPAPLPVDVSLKCV